MRVSNKLQKKKKKKKSGAQRFDPNPQQREKERDLWHSLCHFRGEASLRWQLHLSSTPASTLLWSRWEMKLAELRDKDLRHALTPDATLTDFTAPWLQFKAQNDNASNVTNQ